MRSFRNGGALTQPWNFGDRVSLVEHFGQKWAISCCCVQTYMLCKNFTTQPLPVCDNVLSPHLKATSCCLAYQIRIDMLDTCLTEKQLCRLQQVLRVLSLLLEQGLLHSGPSSLNPGVKEQNAEP